MSPSTVYCLQESHSLVGHDQAERCGVFANTPAGPGRLVVGGWG